MRTKKVLALLLSAAMTISMIGCGDNSATTDTTGETTTEATEAPADEAEAPADEAEAPAEESASGEVSIDFEDGLYAFVGMDTAIAGNADASVVTLEDYNGSKAVKVTNQGKVSYLAIAVDALLGDSVADLKTIELSMGTENPDGTFYASAGKIYAFLGESNAKNSVDWSVYLETANPKTISYTIPDDQAFVAGSGNYVVVSLETDNGKTEGATPANFYVDNIALKDASGNVLSVDTSAEYVAVSGAADRSNLCALAGAVEFADFAAAGDGWSQAGMAMPQEIIDALVPGAVVEISYTSENGDMWLVMPEATAGWMRVGDGTNGSAYVNSSKNIAQVTYEQIAEFCGDDVSTWGATMQCEASGAWEVTSIKVGQKAPSYALSNVVEFTDFAAAGDGWAQGGMAMPQEIIDALVPGSVVEITYTSESGKMWLVMPEATAGWMRVGDGTNGTAVADGTKAYVTYEQIAEFCGDDISAWGATMQCESDTAWEVTAIKVGTASEMKMLNNVVNFEGFECSGDGWAQNGFDMPQEIIDALVPGSVVTINYTSESGKMWLVIPNAAAGWMRVGDGTVNTDVANGTTCQVTYEQLVEACGDDISTWGTMMQCESDTAWAVTSVGVGVAAE